MHNHLHNEDTEHFYHSMKFPHFPLQLRKEYERIMSRRSRDILVFTDETKKPHILHNFIYIRFILEMKTYKKRDQISGFQGSGWTIFVLGARRA